MKNKLLIFMLLLGAYVGISAQETSSYYTPKWSNNIFISVGAGVNSVNYDGFGKVAPHFNLSLGKLITPTWGVRAQINGLSQHLSMQDWANYKHRKNYFGANVDAMINLATLFAGANPDRVFEVYGFAGPMIEVAKSPDTVGYDGETQTKQASSSTSTRTRVGASAGLGLKFNINKSWAIDVEARGAIAPSIFGYMSNRPKAEGTGMLTAGFTYIFGGKKFTKVQDRVVEKEVMKEVVKEVPTEVVKEVVKEVPVASAAATAIFFKINKSEINEEGMVNVKLMAKTMKANPNVKYMIAGYADKATGTPSINQTLSEKRAQAVYDALIAEGVDASQLEKVAMGGTDPMFEKDYLNRVVIMEVK